MKPNNENRSAPVPQPGRDGRLPSLLTVNVANMTDAEVGEALDIADLSEWAAAASHVNLSLSKKGRWKAVESLKKDLENGVFSDENYSVYVIERCWLNRQSNCEEITSSKSVITNYYGSSNLFNADTLFSKKKNKTKRKSESKNCVQEVSGESPAPSDELPTIPELRVEIVRPHERWIPGTSATSRRRRERKQRKHQHTKNFPRKAFKSTLWAIVPQVTDDWGANVQDNWDAPVEDWSTVQNHSTLNQNPTQRSSKKKRPVTKPDKNVPTKQKKTLPTLALDFDLEFDFSSEESYKDEELEDYNEERLGVMTLEDYIVKGGNTEVGASKECAKRNKPALTKDNIRVIDEKEFAKFAPIKDSSVLDDVKDELYPSLPATADVTTPADDTTLAGDINNNVKKDQKDGFTVKLDNTDVSSEVLADTFGARYIECGCYPRRFLLDMTGAVRSVPHWLMTPKIHSNVIHRMRYRGRGRGRGRARGDWVTKIDRRHYTHFERTPKPVTSSGFLLFEEEHDGRFRVRLETDAEVDVKLWTSELEACIPLSPQALADTLCDFLNKQETSTRLKPFDGNKPGVTLCNLKTLLEWPDADSYHSSPFPVSANQTMAPLVTGSTETAECCSICYDVIDMSSRDSQGLALTSCGHWFCKACWKSHVATNVESGAVHITCPEFNCETRVDEGTMASLLTLRQLKMYKSRLDDMEIQTSDSKLWCPKPGCGRIVSVREGSTSNGCVHCECGVAFCVQCRGHPHWPADCSHLRAYEKDLKRFGDDSVFSWTSDARRVVKGKKCPECQYFIEKNMGCPNMVCRCGFSFCWQCLKPWDKHPYNPDCYTKSDTHGAEHLQDVYFEDLSERPQSRTRIYLLALTSRRKQQHRQRQALGSHVTKMKRELKALVSRHKLLEAGAFKKTVAKKEDWCRDVAQLRQILEETETREGKHLLDWVFNLVFEIHHVIEYSAVVIGHHKDDPRLRNTPRLVQTLMFLVSRMEAVFQEGVHQKMTKIPVQLARYANMALKTLSELRNMKPHFPAFEQEVTS